MTEAAIRDTSLTRISSFRNGNELQDIRNFPLDDNQPQKNPIS